MYIVASYSSKLCKFYCSFHYTLNNVTAEQLHLQMQREMKRKHVVIYTVNIKKYYILKLLKTEL